MINAGDYNKRITIQVKGDQTDSDGYPLENDWSKVMEVWAKVVPVSARDYVSAMATQTENITRFVIRYRKGLDTDMRILYKNRVFNITSIINDYETNQTLTIIASEVVL